MDRWRVDSHQALGTWLDYGGAAFLSSHSVVDVSARLRHSEDGKLEWSVVGVARGSQAFQLVRTDAESGRVID